ncbi:antibiotic biosynthesis monooxygenase family protein [Micromonospora sp. NPDC005806]|uniref:antibiotic biosynthesis monooxygenase family protein n=1 Tax=Micromonospora sp. NPDC005806 TaxID=3364234 RepID=UPI0036866FDD
MATPYWTRPEPPYHVAIFTITPSGIDPEGYAEMNKRMVKLAEAQPGYLGRESAVLPNGSDLVVIYYADAESIRTWKRNSEHVVAQRLGRQKWLARYRVEVARVERAYEFAAGPSANAAPDAEGQTCGSASPGQD